MVAFLVPFSVVVVGVPYFLLYIAVVVAAVVAGCAWGGGLVWWCLWLWLPAAVLASCFSVVRGSVAWRLLPLLTLMLLFSV